MRALTKNYGIRGAIAFGIVGLLLLVLPGFLPYQSFAQTTLQRFVGIITFPVWGLWMAALSIFRVRGDEGMRFLLLIYGSTIAYFAFVDFAVGAVFARSRKSE